MATDPGRLIAVSDSDGHTQHVVPRAPARQVLDTIRTHAGNGHCSECGHDDFGDGHIAIVAALLDGAPVELLSLAEPGTDADAEVTVTPLAVILTGELAARLTAAPPIDVDAGEVVDVPAPPPTDATVS